ncbi:hypothetical protein MSTO_05560 [Mycobacterium stomatepiae]|uniref:Thioredoxin domain-containing protein n=2 Tax=Mycobacterium stomatepiae TaxID=470076 RepID=A0A7I7Q2K1_9MYCO|nr:hypothetical protein MSTO_05560 [Mycobacterium stomatepiae]
MPTAAQNAASNPEKIATACEITQPMFRIGTPDCNAANSGHTICSLPHPRSAVAAGSPRTRLAGMAIESTMLALGTPAPPFTLPNPATGTLVSLNDLTGPALVVTFICNHCPYVKHVASGLAALGRDLAEQGVAMVGISSNDVVTYPQDGPDEMVAEARRHGWTFPYLYDETQDVARAFSAACTPDTFVFDGERRLVYRGQLDDSRPKNDVPVTGADIRAAVDAVLAGRPVETDQRPSIGCGIKWR